MGRHPSTRLCARIGSLGSWPQAQPTDLGRACPKTRASQKAHRSPRGIKPRETGHDHARLSPLQARAARMVSSRGRGATWDGIASRFLGRSCTDSMTTQKRRHPLGSTNSGSGSTEETGGATSPDSGSGSRRRRRRTPAIAPLPVPKCASHRSSRRCSTRTDERVAGRVEHGRRELGEQEGHRSDALARPTGSVVLTEEATSPLRHQPPGDPPRPHRCPTP